MPLTRLTAPVLAALLVTGPALAAKVDVVLLQNGSRVLGEIKSMSRARLELSTDDMGTLKIEWAKVAAVTAPEFFEVETMGGRLHFGALRPGSGEGRLEVVSSDRATSLALRDVARIEMASGSADAIVTFDGKPGTFIGIIPAPGENQLDVASNVLAALPALNGTLPKGMMSRPTTLRT